MANLPKDVSDLIEKLLQQSIQNFIVTVHEENKKGEGYIGDIIFLSVKHKNTGKQDHLVIKIVSSSEFDNTVDFLSSSYLNEIYFYTKVWPSLREFQKEFSVTKYLDIAAKCYGYCSERKKEKIILDNLKFQNYSVHPKSLPLNDELYEQIFELYGKYHALSFAMKHHQPDNFVKLTSLLKNNWIGIKDTAMIITGIKSTFMIIKDYLEIKQEHKVIEKLKPYIEHGTEIFAESTEYTGPYSVIVHGDCWSNNLMLKYNDSKQLEDIKLIDFQMAMSGTPVYDLTYTFYSGATFKTMNKWEHFLKIYHKSLGKSVKEYNLNVDNIYPYEELKNEWSKYSQFGFIMSLLIWGAKFTKEDEVEDLDVTETMEWSFVKNEKFINILLDLVKHFYEHNWLYRS